MLPLKGDETKLNRDVPGVGKRDEVFYYIRHENNIVVIVKLPNTPPEIKVSKEDIRFEPGDNDEDWW